MRFGSLFAGIGGLDLGLEASGMECVWQVERDEYCQRVLARHWPEVPRFEEVGECGSHNLEPVDLICGGFPCQPVSAAGRRGGVDDERWLWPEFARIIRDLRPRWVVGENVTGLLSANAGGAMGEILGDLASCGYDAVWDVFPAGGPSGVGAPHRRERVFIVAHTNAEGLQGQRRQHSEGGSAGQRVTGSGGIAVEGGWFPEPSVGRVANGVPSRVDRLKCLGNAVVPQVARGIGRQIMRADG